MITASTFGAVTAVYMAEDDDGVFIMKRVFIGKELVKGREQVTADIAAGVEFLLGKKSMLAFKEQYHVLTVGILI